MGEDFDREPVHGGGVAGVDCQHVVERELYLRRGQLCAQFVGMFSGIGVS
ncbi:hypothetical protein AB0P36_31185 [Streptomyces flavidovirens]